MGSQRGGCDSRHPAEFTPGPQLQLLPAISSLDTTRGDKGDSPCGSDTGAAIDTGHTGMYDTAFRSLSRKVPVALSQGPLARATLVQQLRLIQQIDSSMPYHSLLLSGLCLTVSVELLWREWGRPVVRP